MNDDSNRSQLNSLKAELERVELDLRFLKVKAAELESRIATQERTADANVRVEGLIESTAPLPEPAPIAPAVVTPPPLPKMPPVYQAVSLPLIEPAPPVIAKEVVAATAPKVANEFARASIPPLAAPAHRESFEMRLGTYWFVRIGIVMVLTAMVFLGNYAYQHYVGLLGPLGKVILMYLGSGALLAAGTILPRRQDKLKNYGQVLFAGGLAGVYFTTYAAHHFENLRVIGSPVLDGILLLAWTSFIVWLADRRKSEVTAVFAIGLAYYTALITNVGNFTLASNFLLAAAAVFFLVRNRWVALTFLSIAASYGSYLYWRYYAASAGIEEFAGRLSICGYWVIFTSAVFLSRHTEFAGPRRAGFLSFNNAAAFVLLTFSFLHQRSGGFWQLSLAAGAILLCLSALAAKLIDEDVMPRRAYLAQGLLLITLGIITKLSGPTLALVLAAESALLLIFSTQWKSQLVRAASAIVAALSSGWLLCNLHAGDEAAWAKAAGVFALLLFDAFWISKHEPEIKGDADARLLPTYFSAVALFTWTAATFVLAQPLQIAPILGATAIALTAAQYAIRTRELALLAQPVLAIGLGQLTMLIAAHKVGSTWTPPAVVVMSLAMAVWWKRQKRIELDAQAVLFLEVLFAGAAAAITQLYLPQAIRGEGVLTASWILTFTWTALAIFIRSWPIGVSGQVFLIIAAATQSAAMLFNGNLDTSHHSVELTGAAIVLAATAHVFTNRRPEAAAIRIAMHFYQWLAAILALAWVQVHVDRANHFIALAIAFAVSFGISLTNRRHWFAPGLMLLVAGVVNWLVGLADTGAGIENFFAILIIAAAHFAARRKPDRLPLSESAHQFWMTGVAAALWLFVSRWVIVHSSGAHFYLTASWALLAFVLFGLGFALHERVYRWAALAVLGSALLRVVMLDVWKLETIYRIFSFLALGIVLLALGYFYTRFQEKITRWL